MTEAELRAARAQTELKRELIIVSTQIDNVLLEAEAHRDDPEVSADCASPVRLYEISTRLPRPSFPVASVILVSPKSNVK